MTTLTLEQAREDYPTICATSGDSKVSEKYSFVSTENLIENFQELGLTLDSIKIPNTKKSKKYVKHMVRMNMPMEYHTDGKIPQILIINSHDRTCGLTIQLGVFRLVCGNGLVVCDSSFERFQKRHISLTMDEAKEIINEAIAEFKMQFDIMNKFENFILTQDQKKEFVSEALDLVYNDRANRYEMSDFMTPKRIEDQEDSLFNIMNIFQETFMKGESRYVTKKGHRKSRVIKSIDKDVAVNKILWGLMNQFYTRNN